MSTTTPHTTASSSSAAARPACRCRYYLQQRGIDHVVLEKHTPMHAWRTQRWDNFCLVTPNWQCQLPGWHYARRRPARLHEARTRSSPTCDGFARHVNAAAARGRGGAARRGRARDGGFAGRHQRRATARPTRWWWPRAATTSPSCRAWPSGCRRDIVQIHSEQYRNPQALPRGRGAGGGLRASRARRSPKTCTWPAARWCWPPATRRAAPASTAAGRGRLAGRHGLLRHAGARAPAARGRARQHQPLRDRPRRRARHRPAPLRAARACSSTARSTGLDGEHAALRSPTCASTSTRPTASTTASTPRSTSYIAEHGHRRAAGERLRAGLAAGGERTDAGPARGRHRAAWSGASASRPTSRWLDAPVFNGRGQPAPRARRDRACRACTSSACPGCTPGARGASPGVARDALYLAEQIEAREAAHRPAAERAMADPLLS